MYNDDSNPTLTGVVFIGNRAIDNGGMVSVTYSDVQGGYAGTNILSTDPLLGTLGDYGGFTPTIPLLPGSSAINAGNPAYCTGGSDQRGVSYVDTCDIGSFEYDYQGVYFARPIASGAGNCDWRQPRCVSSKRRKPPIARRQERA